jgi:hypothetical protein
MSSSAGQNGACRNWVTTEAGFGDEGIDVFNLVLDGIGNGVPARASAPAIIVENREVF